MNSKLKETLDTITKIRHVFACPGFVHVMYGFMVLKSGDGYVCRYCRRPVTDVTKTPVGNYYFQAGRPDLGVRK